jgi:hypothetical protein
MSLKGKQKSIPEVAEDLGVDMVVAARGRSSLDGLRSDRRVSDLLRRANLQ